MVTRKESLPPSLERDMWTIVATFLLGTIGAFPAHADSWRAKPVLQLGAPPHCKDANASNLFFDLTQTDRELSVKTNGGEAFSAPVAVDGYVSATLTVPVGNRNFSVDLVGNAQTQEIEFSTDGIHVASSLYRSGRPSAGEVLTKAVEEFPKSRLFQHVRSPCRP